MFLAHTRSHPPLDLASSPPRHPAKGHSICANYRGDRTHTKSSMNSFVIDLIDLRIYPRAAVQPNISYIILNEFVSALCSQAQIHDACIIFRHFHGFRATRTGAKPQSSNKICYKTVICILIKIRSNNSLILRNVYHEGSVVQALDNPRLLNYLSRCYIAFNEVSIIGVRFSAII